MSLPLSSLPVGVDLSSSLDGLYYGYVISTALFGITLVQGWVYLNINSDGWALRLFVFFLVALDFVNTGLSSQILHHYLVANFGNLLVVTKISTETRIETLMTIILAFAGHLFFAGYVYRLRRCHRSVPATIVVIGCAAFGTGIASVVQLFRNDSLANLGSHSEKVELGVASGLAALADFISSIAIIWSTSSSRTGIKNLDSPIEKIYQFAVTQGIFVGVDQVMMLILLLVKPDKLYWMPFHLCLGKAYVITIIAILNARDSAQANVHARAEATNMFVAAPGTYSNSRVMDGNHNISQQGYGERALSEASLDDYELQASLKPAPTPTGGPTKIFVSRDKVVT